MRKILFVFLFIFLILGTVFIVLPELSRLRKINPATDNYTYYTDNMLIQIAEFQNGREIPKEYTCQGQNIAPLIAINDVPNQAKSLVLIMDDPDAPVGRWFHWLIWNIPVSSKVIDRDDLPTGAVVGKNSSGNIGYDGPCPPYGTHRYFFKLYALDIELKLDPNTDPRDVEKELEGHIISRSEYMGIFTK